MRTSLLRFQASARRKDDGQLDDQITFDTQGYLLPDEQDRMAEALDETFRVPLHQLLAIDPSPEENSLHCHS